LVYLDVAMTTGVFGYHVRKAFNDTFFALICALLEIITDALIFYPPVVENLGQRRYSRLHALMFNVTFQALAVSTRPNCSVF